MVVHLHCIYTHPWLEFLSPILSVYILHNKGHASILIHFQEAFQKNMMSTAWWTCHKIQCFLACSRWMSHHVLTSHTKDMGFVTAFLTVWTGQEKHSVCHSSRTSSEWLAENLPGVTNFICHLERLHTVSVGKKKEQNELQWRNCWPEKSLFLCGDESDGISCF